MRLGGVCRCNKAVRVGLGPLVFDRCGREAMKRCDNERTPVAGPGIQMSLRELAKAMGVKHPTVLAIEQRALRKLKEKLKEDGLDMEDFFG